MESEFKTKLDFKTIKSSNNLVEELEEEDLVLIGHQVVKGYKIDEASRSEWQEIVDKAMDIAKQVMEQKTFPWTNASNVKFPLIARAGIDYAARTLPEVIQNEKVVRAVVVGQDPQDDKYKRANRVAKFISYMLAVASPDWEDGTDKLLQILPILGTVFKKTYYDEAEKRVVSELCVPNKIVVNYDTQSLDTARRVTHVITRYINDIVERQRRGIFNKDIKIDELHPENAKDQEDQDFPITLLEQHCFLDLDQDGYKEPYIVTVHKETGKVFRIVNRFGKIEKKNDEIVKIEAKQFFTDYHFIRNPDGGFYSMGFGSLLLPLNKAINALINQIIDAGTLANTQGGFLGRGLRIKNGDIKVKMGEWKVLDVATGTSIKENVFPLPVREPSETLYKLLGLLIQVGQDLSSTTDALSGKQPVQNVASTTFAQLVEQGTKVFVAINKRVYRSLKKEYKKIYELYADYLSQDEYAKVLDDPEANVKADFEVDTLDIHPVADPTVSSENQRIIRAGAIQQLRTADPRQADVLLLQSMGIDQSTIEKLLPPPDPNAPPPPETQEAMAKVKKLEAEVAKLSADAKLSSEKNQMELRNLQQQIKESEARIGESQARSWKMQHDALMNEKKMLIVGKKSQTEQQMKAADILHKVDKDKKDAEIKEKKVDADLQKADKAKPKVDKKKEGK